MPTTYEEAYDTITNQVLADWPAAALAIVGSAVEMRFTGVEKGDIPKVSFARFTMQPVLERQATLRDATGVQRYTSTGLIHIQVFTPRTADLAEEWARKLAVVARNIFRGKSFDGCIWFRNVRINNLDPEAAFIRKTMVAEYEYDEMG